MRRRNVIVGREPAGNRAEYWRGHIRACESSGLSIAGYCRHEGLSTSGYHWWKRRLKARNESGPSKALSVAAAFAEVRVASEAPAQDAGIEVVLAGPRCIRVRPGFDASTLAGVVRVLEGLGC